ncbi:MAG: 5'/3'-nucleotidase SurE [Lysobacterales bacterium]|jgi:5'-nucleotidase
MGQPPPLHILLTNDDGHEAPGINALYSVFTEAGHDVSMVAPSTEQSSTGMSITSRRNLALEQLGDGNWHLDGQPADTVLVALRHLLQDRQPDLVLSGVNFGPNLGAGLHISGTIGAAVMAALLGVPAIAVSVGFQFHEIDDSPLQFPSTHEAFEPAACFTRTVVDKLRATSLPGAPLLPPNVLLNINYPALPGERIRGILYPEVSDIQLIGLDYERCNETGHVVPRYITDIDPEKPHEQEQGDVRAHLEGYITISAVRPNWNPPEEQKRALHRRLEGLEDFV